MGFSWLGLFLSALIVTMAQCRPDADEGVESMDTPDGPNQDRPAGAITAVASGVNRFALSLLKAAVEMKGANQNVLVSPLSASLATAMLYQGAKGATKSEIQSGLSFPADDNTFEEGFSQLNANMNNMPGVTMELANRVYLEKSLEGKLKQTYQDALTKVHKCTVATTNFKEASEPARIEINKWVSDKTRDKINNLLPTGSVTADTSLVLVNALYFKGKWKTPFDPQSTTTMPFYLSKSQQVNVSMMFIMHSFQYAVVPELKAKVLSIPYEDEKVNMVLVLPDEIDGVSSVLNKLTTGAFSLDSVRYYYPDVQLWLPKFKIEDSHNLKEVYQKLNMTKLFTEEADFSGIIDPPPSLFVSAAVQKTFMEVNEEGTEASAATGIGLGNRIMEKAVTLKFDHPFVIFLKLASWKNQTESILFAGVVREPSASQKGNDIQDKMPKPQKVSESTQQIGAKDSTEIPFVDRTRGPVPKRKPENFTDVEITNRNVDSIKPDAVNKIPKKPIPNDMESIPEDESPTPDSNDEKPDKYVRRAAKAALFEEPDISDYVPKIPVRHAAEEDQSEDHLDILDDHPIKTKKPVGHIAEDDEHDIPDYFPIKTKKPVGHVAEGDEHDIPDYFPIKTKKPVGHVAEGDEHDTPDYFPIKTKKPVGHVAEGDEHDIPDYFPIKTKKPVGHVAEGDEHDTPNYFPIKTKKPVGHVAEGDERDTRNYVPIKTKKRVGHVAEGDEHYTPDDVPKKPKEPVGHVVEGDAHDTPDDVPKKTKEPVGHVAEGDEHDTPDDEHNTPDDEHDTPDDVPKKTKKPVEHAAEGDEHDTPVDVPRKTYKPNQHPAKTWSGSRDALSDDHRKFLLKLQEAMGKSVSVSESLSSATDSSSSSSSSTSSSTESSTTSSSSSD